MRDPHRFRQIVSHEQCGEAVAGGGANHQILKRPLQPDIDGGEQFVEKHHIWIDRERAIRTFERGLNPAGVVRQLRAILASGSRKERLAALKVPTLVIHGTVDPLVRPEGGKDTAASIPGAKLLMVEGMGHALPIPMWPQVIDAIDKHAHGASAK